VKFVSDERNSKDSNVPIPRTKWKTRKEQGKPENLISEREKKQLTEFLRLHERPIAPVDSFRGRLRRGKKRQKNPWKALGIPRPRRK